MLEKGEVIPMRLMGTLSSKESKAGETMWLQVSDNVLYSGRVVVRKGARASAVVTRAETKHTFGQGGRVGLQIRDVELADGSLLLLDTKINKGGGGLGEKKYKAVVVASILLLSPAGTAFALLNHGQEIVMPEGTHMDAQIVEETALEANKFPEASAEERATAAAAVTPVKEGSLSVATSAGDGSVWVDGTYMGEAPLTLTLKRGVYTLRVYRDGYHEWKERVAVEPSAGSVLKLSVGLVSK